MIPFALILTALAGFAQSQAPIEAPLPARPAAELVFQFLRLPDGTFLHGTHFRLRQDADSLALIPAREGHFAVVMISCWKMGTGGRLEECLVTADPAGLGYEEAARRLIEDVAFEGDPSLVGRTERAFLQLQLSNSSTPPRNGPCFPPRCHIIIDPARRGNQ